MFNFYNKQFRVVRLQISYIQAIWIFDAPPGRIRFLHILSHACINYDILARNPTFFVQGESIKLNFGSSRVLSALRYVFSPSLYTKRMNVGLDILFRIFEPYSLLLISHPPSTPNPVNSPLVFHLRWFWHIQCRLITVPVRESLALQVDGSPRGRGRPKKMWMEVVKIGIKKCNLTKDLAQDTRYIKLEKQNSYSQPKYSWVVVAFMM